MAQNWSLLRCDLELLEPIIVVITPQDDGLDYEFIEMKSARDYLEWPTGEIFDLEFTENSGMRFLVSEVKTQGMPVFVQSKVFFASILVMLHEGDTTLPFHCPKCADEYMLWFEHKQDEWGHIYHGQWYRKYIGGLGEEADTYH